MAVEVIKKIFNMGHEIGYHYEDLAKAKGNIEDALSSFRQNLKQMRSIVPVNTICMHGSPLSRHDNRGLWNCWSYRDLGIIGEPYFDIDFGKVFYLTDTGRRWNGSKSSVRDRVVGSGQDKLFVFPTTVSIIGALKAGAFPTQAMLTVHPQRWTDAWLPWLSEMVLQNVKNIAKAIVVRRIHEG